MCAAIRRGTGQLNIFMGVIFNSSWKFKLLGLQREPLGKFPSLVGHPNLPIEKPLRRVLGLLTIIILKRVSENIFFQSIKFTTCKVKDEKEVTNSLIALNLLTIIHPFQGKKHLKTYWNFNCNLQQY